MKQASRSLPTIGVLLSFLSVNKAESVAWSETQLDSHPSATPDLQYATVISPEPGQAVKLGKHFVLNMGRQRFGNAIT